MTGNPSDGDLRGTGVRLEAAPSNARPALSPGDAVDLVEVHEERKAKAEVALRLVTRVAGGEGPILKADQVSRLAYVVQYRGMQQQQVSGGPYRHDREPITFALSANCTHTFVIDAATGELLTDGYFETC